MKGIFWQIQLLSLNARQSLNLVKYTFAKRYLSKIYLHMYLINDICHNVRSTFFSKHLKLKLPVPTLSFVNIQEPEGDEFSNDFNNNRRMAEIKILKKHNPDNYTAIIFTNKTHYIFDMIEPAKEIIEQIKSIIPLSFYTF